MVRLILQNKLALILVAILIIISGHAQAYQLFLYFASANWLFGFARTTFSYMKKKKMCILNLLAVNCKM